MAALTTEGPRKAGLAYRPPFSRESSIRVVKPCKRGKKQEFVKAKPEPSHIHTYIASVTKPCETTTPTSNHHSKPLKTAPIYLRPAHSQPAIIPRRSSPCSTITRESGGFADDAPIDLSKSGPKHPVHPNGLGDVMPLETTHQPFLDLPGGTQETPLDLSQAQRLVFHSPDLRILLRMKESESPRRPLQSVTFTDSPSHCYDEKHAGTSQRMTSLPKNPLPPPRRHTRTKPSLSWDTRTGQSPPIVPLMSIQALSPTRPRNRGAPDHNRRKSDKSTFRGFNTGSNYRVRRCSPEPRPLPESGERVRRVMIHEAPPDYSTVPPPPLYKRATIPSRARRHNKYPPPSNTQTMNQTKLDRSHPNRNSPY